jgi:hypothetical protein
MGPRTQSSPTSSAPHSVPVSWCTVRTSAVGMGRPTVDTRARASSSARMVVGEQVSVMP